jgi:O-antigen/teichoic acid export membrane protein
MKLLRHTVFNLIGLGAPLLVAVGTIPVLIHELGPSRFGLLTLIWAVVSYFGLFDLGLGRALTQQLAVVFSNKEYKTVGPLVGTATVLMAMLGVVAGVLMAAAASWGVGLINDVPDRQEAVNAVYAMALAMPFIVLTSGFRGVLEARHAFGIVNLIRLPMGLFTFLGPVAVVLYGGGPRLDYIAWVLVAGRVIACIVHSYYAWRVLPKERSVIIFRSVLVRPLCISGGWMTVSNIVGPLMGYLDRFVVGAFASAQALAYYATPQELISKFSIVPSALMGVLFPQFAKISTNFSKLTIETLERAASLTTALCMPAFLLIALCSNEILTSWIDLQFAQSAAQVLALMASGMLINSISFIPLTWLQAANHSKKVALIHVIELPLFCLFLWIGLRDFGILGAAVAWVARIVLDSCLLWLTLARLDIRLAKVAKKYMFQSIFLGSLIYLVSFMKFPIAWKLVIIFMTAAYFGLRIVKIFRFERQAHS